MAQKEESVKNFKDLTQDELRAELEKNRHQLWDLKLRHGSAPLKNPLEIRIARRNIARILTYSKAKSAEAK